MEHLPLHAFYHNICRQSLTLDLRLSKFPESGSSARKKFYRSPTGPIFKEVNMKAQPATAAKPLSAVEEMLAKRETLIADRDSVLSRLMELNAGIESLDTVIAMFDPNHVPLDIRRAQGTPMLTISAQPILAEVAKTAAAAAKIKPDDTQTELVEGAKPATKAAKQTAKAKKVAAKASAQAGKTAKTSTSAAVAAKTDEALADAVAARSGQKTTLKDQHQARITAAREQMREYFGDIDKLKTLEDIVKSSSDGLPFRSICEAFAERHPIDIAKPEVKKVFSDRLSALLHGLSQQNVVMRGERQGAEGKENVWLYTRAPRNGKGQQASVAAAG
ncbi:hypothetical protein HFN89_06355 [Rhizobium laguerreae]|nr:hypothetical protein [Rhizobium laguerreae]